VAARLADINADLYRSMRAAPYLAGMGTTVAGLLLTPGTAVWFNVGDSRVYRQCRGKFEQLSTDDVPPGPRTGMITQTLGGSSIFLPISPHVGEDDLVLPSRWLLCSDGLSDMLDDMEIAGLIGDSPEKAVRALFAAAMDAGGMDNISMILVSASS
jgi:serine/threonine protein phosphatase PrpC